MIAAIVAADMNFGIGYDNQLLESIPEDLKYFKQLTTDKVVVMGSRTWASLPKKPLPNRYNIIVTRNPMYDEETDNYSFHTLEDTIDFLMTTDRDVFIIGGGFIYEQLLPYCNKIYLTYIWKEHDNVDTYFPDFFESDWEATELSEWKEYNGIQYQFQHYERID